MRVLVCGGAGYIGTHFVRHLLRRTSHEVIIVDNLSTTKGSFAHVECAERYAAAHASAPSGRLALLEIGDVRDEAAMDAVFLKHAPIDVVVHMCAYLNVGESVAEPLMYYNNNVVGIVRILETMRRHGCDKLIFSSSCSVYGDGMLKMQGEEKGKASAPWILPSTPMEPASPYAETKLMGEWILKACARAYGIKSVALRYFNACGAHEEGDIGEANDFVHIIPCALHVVQADILNAYNAKHHPEFPVVKDHFGVFGTDFPTPDGTCIRSYVHVMDLATAHEKALDYLAQLTSRDTDRFFMAANLGTPAGYSVREVIDAVRRVTGHPVPVKEMSRRPGDVAIVVAVDDTAERLLGWKPAYVDIDSIVRTSWNFQKLHPFGYDPVEPAAPSK